MPLWAKYPLEVGSETAVETGVDYAFGQGPQNWGDVGVNFATNAFFNSVNYIGRAPDSKPSVNPPYKPQDVPEIESKVTVPKDVSPPRMLTGPEIVDKYTANLPDTTSPYAGPDVTQYDASGGYESAIAMFEEITGQKLPQDIIDRGRLYQTLPDETVIGVRNYSGDSSGNLPTLEIQIKNNGEVEQFIKIRFK